MLKLYRLKEQKEKEKANGGAPKASAAVLRMQKDIADLSLPDTCKLEFPNPDDYTHFKLRILPDDGYYSKGAFNFTIDVPSNYPHAAPKVKCVTKIYHPNIDLEGNVCLNILREDWKPILNINAVVYGLQFLFLEPNASDPLNREAANVFQQNKQQFERNVKTSMRGGSIDGEKFDRCTR